MRVLLGIVVSWFLLSPTVFAGTMYTYEDMTSDLTRLSNAYPGMVHVKVIGQTAYHRNIYAIAVGHGATRVVITASHHAREWITTCVLMKMMESYCRAYQNKQSICGYPVRPVLNACTIWFIPMVNPDGVTLQQLGPGAFPPSMYRTFVQWNKGRRDFTEWKANADGIDLNLQYDGEWDKVKKTSPLPASKGYKGSVPFQAEEAIAVKNFLEEVDPAFEVAYHASGDVIFSNPAPDARYPIARDLSDLTGYRVVNIRDSYGGLTDWWTGTMKKVGLTIEVGPFFGEKAVPSKFLNEIYRENEAVGLYLASRASLDLQLSRMEF